MTLSIKDINYGGMDAVMSCVGFAHSNPVLWGSKQVCVLVFYDCCINLLQLGGLKHDEFSHTFGA